MKGVFFIPFPKPFSQPEKCRTWIADCGRTPDTFNVNKITKDTYICSKLFIGESGPSNEYPNPVPAVQLGSISRVKRSRPMPKQRHSTPVKKKRISIKKKLEASESTSMSTMSSTNDFSGSIESIFISNKNSAKDDDMDISLLSETCIITSDKTTQTDLTFEDLQYFKDNELKNTNAMKRKFIVDAVTTSDENCNFWTGIRKVSVLQLIFNFILPIALKTKLWMGSSKQTKSSNSHGPRKRLLNHYEEFLLTLIRIRRGFDTNEIKYLFGVSQSQVSHIFITWINLLEKCFRPLLEWPSADMIKCNLPSSFKKFPKTRVIIDCSEIYIQKPRSIDAQRLTWSSYKTNNTFKFLLGIAPSGQVTFLSKLFSGAISDREIVIQSKLMDLIEKEDDVMADRGFNIRDLLLAKNATLNIPTFSGGKQLSSRAVVRSRQIASVRIHVERAMKRIKNFKILQGIIPLQLKNSLDQILLICTVLGNLSKPLVKE